MLKLVVVSVVSALLAGMGIGGGALFVILSTLFLGYEQKEAQFVNLVMFIAVGVSTTISNFKNKKIEKNSLPKIIPLIILGSIIGTFLMKKIGNENLRMYFSVFMAIIGLYEIISSLIKIKKGKNKNET